MGRVEQREHGDGDLAAFEVERQELVDVGEAAIDRVERLDDESVDLRVGAAHLARVMRVGGHSLQSVDQQFLQAGDILAERRLARLDARAVGPGEDCVATGVGGDPGRRAGRGDDAADDLEDLVRIEIHVRDGGEERVFKQWRDGGVAVGGGNGDDARGKPPGGEDQRVLQFGRFRRLAALADDFAACAAGGLFTLIAKHGFDSPSRAPTAPVGGRLKALWEPLAA